MTLYKAVNMMALKSLVSTALDRGFGYMMSSILPSAWSPDGGGWQEQWKASFAGFYASCDGVLLINTCPPERDRGRPDGLLERVYSKHLCLVVDEHYPASDTNLRRMRETCLGTTTKLAKFVQASSKKNSLRPEHQQLVDRIRDKLVACGNKNNGTWPANIDDQISDGTSSPMISATCESLVALSYSYTPDVNELILQGADFLAQTITSTTNKKWKLSALWALTEISPHLNEQRRQTLKQQAHSTIPLLGDLDDDCVTDTFSNSLGHGDYYHFNAKLLGAKSILRLHLLGLLESEDYLNICAPIIHHVASHIADQGRFFTHDGSNMGPRFWEHYQAMSLLSDYIDFTNKRGDFSERTYMWVSPKYFEKTTFAVDAKLAVVLMPFRPTWSKDVFDAISKAAGKRGFECWRSDLKFSDDQIMQTVWEKINQASFVVAECTKQNPNVFYELGISHTVGKPVFICAQNIKDTPFDLRAIRSFPYGGATPTQLKALQTALIKFIDESI